MESVSSSVTKHETHDPNKLEVLVVYNGVTKSLTLEKNMAVAAAVEKAAHLFNITANVHTLALYMENGMEIPRNGSIGDAGVKNGDLLALRPSAVLGG